MNTDLKENFVWLIGDHYDAWISIRQRARLDNDPEHQPANSMMSQQPKRFYMPSGLWYVKRFLDRMWLAHRGQKAITVAYTDESKLGIDEYKCVEPFALDTSTIAYSLDKFKKKPDDSTNDRLVLRIDATHGYCSALETLEAMRSVLELQLGSPAEVDVRKKLEDIRLYSP